MRLTLASLAAAAALLLVPGADAKPRGESNFQAAYGIWLSGLPIGTADVSSAFDGQRYKIDLQARLTGLAGLLTGGRGSATATGSVAAGRVVPATFAVTSRNSSESRTVRIGLSSGNVAAVDIVPPLDEKPDRVPVSIDHKRGVVDPVSALLMPTMARGDLTDPDNCNRTIPVFDGAARFDVVLSYQETKTVEKPGYKGPVLVCTARWVPISGHRPDRPAVQFMERNRDMSVWLAPMEASRVLVPLRIAVMTQVGLSVIEASSLALDGSRRTKAASMQP